MLLFGIDYKGNLIKQDHQFPTSPKQSRTGLHLNKHRNRVLRVQNALVHRALLARPGPGDTSVKA